MNYHQPRQALLDDGTVGGWHYTSLNRRTGCYAEGYCRDHEPHDTEQEARECYARWALDHATYDKRMTGQQLRCSVADCDTWTDRLGGPPGYSAFGHDMPLCDEHCNRAGLEAVIGTVAGDAVASW